MTSARRASFAIAAFIALSTIGTAQAECALCSCLVTATPLSFGAFSPTSNANLDAVANIDVSCSGTVALASIEIRMDPGQNGSFAIRRMRSGADLLDYNIYANAARTQIWGNGAGGYGGVTVVNGLGVAVWNSSTPAYGRLPASPTAPPGVYADTVLVTVEW